MRKKTRTRTDGQRLLKKAVDAGTSVTLIATICGVKQPSASAWVHGWSRPEDEHKALLDKHLGIPRESWKTADERRDDSRKEVAREAALASLSPEGA